MSRLNELIAQLCPNGAPKYYIGDICDISRGRVISKDYIRENEGNFPVYSSQTENNGELGRISTFDYDGEYLTWTTDGANAGTVFYRNGKFSITNVCGLLRVKKEDLMTKYLYYTLNVEAPKFVSSGMGNPKLMSNVMARVSVQIPPLPVQSEIVRILDSFTELTVELTVELTAELTARKLQYESYRESLLTFDSTADGEARQSRVAKWFELGDMCNISAGGDAPKEAMSKERTEKYTIPIISNGIGSNAFYGYTNIAKVTQPSVTVAARGTIGYAEYRDYPYFPIIRLLTATPKDTSAIKTKYLYYCLQGKQYNVPAGGIPQLTAPELKKVKIPVPSIEEQERIVAILDRFDVLCNDISAGLPAEIEARQKQYEYYRDKLLTFTEKTS